MLLSAIKCPKISFGKRKSDVKSNSIKFDWDLLIQATSISQFVKFLKFFELIVHRDFLFLLICSQKNVFEFCQFDHSSIWSKNFCFRFAQLWSQGGKFFKNTPVGQVHYAFAATRSLFTYSTFLSVLPISCPQNSFHQKCLNVNHLALIGKISRHERFSWCPIFYENWIGTDKIHMDELSRYRSSSCSGDRNF